MTLFTATLKVTPQVSVPKIKYFKAADPIERTSTMEVRDYGPQAAHAMPVIYRMADVLMPGCKAGDLIRASGGYQLTTELPYYVEVTGNLFLTQSSTAVFGLSLIGAGGRGYNADVEVHHAPLEMHGTRVIPHDGDWYVAMMAYCGGSSHSQHGDTVRVDVGYGDLDVIRYRGAET